jgi:hypothetical protein
MMLRLVAFGLLAVVTLGPLGGGQSTTPDTARAAEASHDGAVAVDLPRIPDVVSDVTVSGKVYMKGHAQAKVDWYLLPGGSQRPSVFTRYYLEVKIASRSGVLSPSPRVAAYFFTEGGDVLDVRVVAEDETLGAAQSFMVYLDTDGYTEMVLVHDQGPGVFLTICAAGKAFKARLPTSNEMFHGREGSDLAFVPTAMVPDVSQARIATASDLAKDARGDLLRGIKGRSLDEAVRVARPSAVLRRQGSQSAGYFYHPGPVSFVRLDRSPSRRLSNEDIQQDLIALGATSEVKLIHQVWRPRKASGSQ